MQIDGTSLTLEAVIDVARGAMDVSLSTDPKVLERIEKSVELRNSLIDSGAPIYGVTTGVGASVDRQVARDRAAEMQHNLVSKCGCGGGPTLPSDATRAAILIRANFLATRYSIAIAPKPSLCVT